MGLHILVVNDDGPPNPHSSPYVHSLVRELQSRGHTVSVCLPHTQRSWIGKAHIIGQTVKPLYYRPPPPSAPAAGLSHEAEQNGGVALSEGQGERGDHGTIHTRPHPKPGVEEWILVDGTPASCVQIGLYHFFQDRGPVDLVVSGPNYGRNTTAVFALSSGTLGGALEAAVCRVKAIALSYAFFTKNHDTGIIRKATKRGVDVIEALWRAWPGDGSVDLYSVNVPLLEGLEEGKVVYAGMLQNYWGPGSCFTEVDGSVDGEEEDEERIREEEGQVEEGLQEGGHKHAPHTHKHFKWSPRFVDVYKSVDEAGEGPGNDGWVVKVGNTSVTPLKANFFQTATHLHGTELKLSRQPKRSMTFGMEPAHGSQEERGAVIEEPALQKPTTKQAEQLEDLLLRSKISPVYALVEYNDAYVQPLILSAMESLLPAHGYTLVKPPSTWSATSNPDISLSSLLPSPDAKILQIMPYESLDFEYAATHSSTTLLNSYMIRKALIRKHFLSATVDAWVSKHPDSVLKMHVKRAEAFEVDYAEFLDDALVEAWDLRASLEKNEQLLEEGKEEEMEWWILKPSMSDRGQGIRLFCRMEQLQVIFDQWEVGNDEEDEDEEGEQENEGDGDDDEDHITTSHLRHFIAQPYIHPPLLIPQLNNRKFHIRVYVLCVGALTVYVYRDMLALFAAKPYTPPTFSLDNDENSSELDLDAHLTNTCRQTSKYDTPDPDLVHLFWSLPLPSSQKQSIFTQICAVTADLFEAAARSMSIHFQPLPHAFEAYGLDFLVDAGGTTWLLEVNAFPDFAQTGQECSDVVRGFWRGVVGKAVKGFVTGNAGGEEEDGMVKVREVDLGRR